MSETMTFEVSGIHCAHCSETVKQEVSAVAGVETVDVEVDAKRVTVKGGPLDEAALRAAIRESGYEAA